MRDVATAARGAGASRIEVTANPHATAFYEQAGFVPAGTTESRFGPASRLRLDLAATPRVMRPLRRDA